MEIREKLSELSKNLLIKYSNKYKTDYERIKQLNHLFSQKQINKLKLMFKSGLIVEECIQDLLVSYKRLHKIQSTIDDIVYLMYGCTKQDREIIEVGYGYF